MKIILGVSAAALLGMVALVAMFSHKITQSEAEPIPSGWYDWANAADKPNAPAGMAAYYTGARCLCADGFTGIKHGDTFTIVSAPRGYSDTLGKTFRAKQRACLNCAD